MKSSSPWKKSYDKSRQINKQRHHFADKGLYSQSYGFSGSCVPESWTWEGWVLKNWCSQTVVIEKIFESHLDCKKMKPVNPKGNQLWIFTGRTDAEAEAPILRSPDVKSWLTGEDPNAGKDWRQKEKGTTEDEVVEWHHRLNGHEFEQTPGVGEGQGSLVWWIAKSQTQLSNWTELNWRYKLLTEGCYTQVR